LKSKFKFLNQVILENCVLYVVFNINLLTYLLVFYLHSLKSINLSMK